MFKFNMLWLIAFIYNSNLASGGNIQGVALNGTLTLAYAIPWSHDWEVGPYMGSAIVTGLREVEKRQLLPGYTIDWVWKDSWCKPLRGTKVVVEMWESVEDLDGIIGAGCSVACQPVSLLAASWNIPVVSYSCESSLLSDTQVYPTFSRTVGVPAGRAILYNSVMDQFGWKRIGIITTNEAVMKEIAVASKNYMEQQGKTIFLNVIETTVDGNDINEENLLKQRAVLKTMKEKVRIILLPMYPNDVRNLLISALDEGMLNGEYAFISQDLRYLIGIKQTYRPEADQFIYNGIIYKENKKPSGPEYEAFAQQVIEDFQHPHFISVPHLHLNASIRTVNDYAGMVHDAVLQWAYGVNRTLEQGFAPDDGARVARNMHSIHFQGITGKIAMDQFGGRDPNVRMEMTQNGTMMPVLDWYAADQMMQKLYNPDRPQDWSGLSWYGNPEVPSDTPPCGWEDQFCSSKSQDKTTIISVFITCILMVALVVVICVVKYNRNYRLKYVDEIIIDQAEIDLYDIRQGTKRYKSGTSFMVSQTDEIKEAKLKIGSWHGIDVALTTFHNTQLDFTDKKIMTELTYMRSLVHDNISNFIGVSSENNHIAIIMSCATKGSLQNILENSSMKMSWEMKTSIAADIAFGMKYLHASKVGSHGHLTSSQCVVDSRWTCKVTGFAEKVVQKYSLNSKNELNPTNLLWTAPERLTKHMTVHDNESKKADVYSYGIILQEIILRCPPYGEDHNLLSADEIVEKVAKRTHPPFRPLVSASTCPPKWRNLMDRCWQEDANNRPDFKGILLALTDINNGQLPKLVDNILARLEEHTDKLEEQVQLRNRDLLEEKGKVLTILRDLLPKIIVDQLQSGMTIQPEYFDETTLFFSDIVGFTNISRRATPMDITLMLNSMYTIFDEVIHRFDVYKVATIGDAYMAASGVPVRNGHRHAQEICNMALNLLGAAESLSIPHMKQKKLKLRIGIHSGPCVGGVIGLKMPKYLLFGDTVSIAEKMEAGGEPMKIHISEATYQLLNGNSSFVLKQRDPVWFMGMEQIITYWLFAAQNSKSLENV